MGRRSTLTGEQQQEIWNRWNENETIAEISKEMKIPYSKVYYFIQSERKESESPQEPLDNNQQQ